MARTKSKPASTTEPKKAAGTTKRKAAVLQRGTTSKTATSNTKAAPAMAGIRIRMYRLGVGDCFLVTLPRRDGTPFHMLIDCGIHMAETGGRDRIRAAVQDILAQTKGKLDVVVGTHEHWDHLSGFHHASDLLQGQRAGSLWCAWTEDTTDPVARSLVNNRDQAVTALWGAMRRLHMGSADDPPRDWEGVLGFFGESPGTGVKAKAAAQAMRGLASSDSDIYYREPGEAPFDEVSDVWRIFVLGPPRDTALMRRAQPRAGTGEAYPLAAAELAAASLAAAVGEDDDPPFASRYQVALDATRTMPFFQAHYWADEIDGVTVPTDTRVGREENAQVWRRIGNAWLDGAEALALQLDKITNNTSLVLALEIGPKAAKDNPVILFAADAQVGNWLSWATVEWPDYAGRKVTGPDLLRRTIVYKVGHHASHNATLMDGGLETMRNLRLAMVPTSEEMATKVKWGTLPWPGLLTRLADLTGGRVLRSDTGATPGAVTMPDIAVVETSTHFDITLPLNLKVKP